jgi:hypothetical protein
MADVVSTFRGREEGEGRGDERGHLVERAGSGGPQERFQFRKGHLDRIEVRTVGRQEPELRADGFDRTTDLWLSMDRQIVEDDDVPGL